MDFSAINQITGTDQQRDTRNFVALTSAALALGVAVAVTTYRALKRSSRK